jgi:hypothetical protein
VASSEYGSLVDTELTSLGINTQAEVLDFRVPGERRINLLSPTGGDMNTVIVAIQTALGKAWVSRKRMRSDALRLFREGAL